MFLNLEVLPLSHFTVVETHYPISSKIHEMYISFLKTFVLFINVTFHFSFCCISCWNISFGSQNDILSFLLLILAIHFYNDIPNISHLLCFPYCYIFSNFHEILFFLKYLLRIFFWSYHNFSCLRVISYFADFLHIIKALSISVDVFFFIFICFESSN